MHENRMKEWNLCRRQFKQFIWKQVDINVLHVYCQVIGTFYLLGLSSNSSNGILADEQKQSDNQYKYKCVAEYKLWLLDLKGKKA